MGERSLKAIVAEQLKLGASRVDASVPTKQELSRAGTSTPKNPRA